MRVLISIPYTTAKLQISLKIVCKICCMVSDNDCDVAVCDIKGRGDFSPPSDFGCTLYIQNLCLHIPIRLYLLSFQFLCCLFLHTHGYGSGENKVIKHYMPQDKLKLYRLCHKGRLKTTKTTSFKQFDDLTKLKSRSHWLTNRQAGQKN